MLDSGEEGVKNRCGWGPNLGEELEWKNDMSATVWFSPFLYVSLLLIPASIRNFRERRRTTRIVSNIEGMKAEVTKTSVARQEWKRNTIIHKKNGICQQIFYFLVTSNITKIYLKVF
jgi:3'-phosphoadenosine 5'-phosphosulfate sulfotransferase